MQLPTLDRLGTFLVALMLILTPFCFSAVKSLVDSSVYFRSVEGLLKQAISIRDHMNNSAQGHR